MYSLQFEEEDDYYEALDVEAQRRRQDAKEERALERYLLEHPEFED